MTATSMTLWETLRRAEQLRRDQPAYVDAGHTATYRDLAERCRSLAGALHGAGVGIGDRVALLMGNGHRYLECYFAVPGMGAIMVPLNNRLALPELRYILEDAGVHTLIADDSYAETARDLASSVKQVLVGAEQYESALASALPAALPADIHEDDLAGLFYTGGTTGVAKGVMLTHRNLLANAMHITVALEYSERDVYLHAAPMFHLADGASTYSVTWVGGCHTFLPSFDAGATIDIIGRERVSAVLLVPAMLTAITEHPRAASADFSSLRMVLHGAAPIASTLLRKSIAVMGCSFAQGYGMTEVAPLATVLTREEDLVDAERLRSAGREIMGVEVTVRRPDGGKVDVGEVGEVVLRGPNVMRGYWNKPEATTEVLVDGWYWTRDLGYLDDAGYLFLVDRAKDMIISGGENVYSIEVEEAICTHDAVLEVAVVGVPDERWGERVHAAIVLRPGKTLDAEELKAHCAQLIAGFKCPRSIEFLDALPRSGAGKILKRDIRDRHWTDTERSIN
ncbi:MAG: long-chain fatty acid--CoA ligase [Actinomycetota bacterium]|nr:long-chain fatty acid--CoA ligase [Actinomycetota bacterium]